MKYRTYFDVGILFECERISLKIVSRYKYHLNAIKCLQISILRNSHKCHFSTGPENALNS